MGFFSNLFGSSSNIERQLEEQYVPMLEMTMKMLPSQAKKTFRDLLKQAKEAALEQGTLNLPQNFGDMLLEKEAFDEKLKAALTKKRNEGVRDEDIRWWGNMHELERQIMIQIDTLNRYSLYLKLREEEGLSEVKAMKKVRKYFPMFGVPDDTSQTTEEERPLPYELKDRINIYIEKRSKTNPEQFKKEIEESTTFNALIRREIKKSNVA